MNYVSVYRMCLAKVNELGINFNFDNNTHLQHPKNMDDIYKNFVYHSQNRSQGCAINFFKEENKNYDLVTKVWECIGKFKFDFSNDFSYIQLFEELRKIDKVSEKLSLEKGKDIQYLELAKTCQCIKQYLRKYQDINAFIKDHEFTDDGEKNWTILKNVSDAIYNVSTELVPDFFKEQDCIKGRGFLIKADIHVKRFISTLFNNGDKLSDKSVYSYIMNMYKNCNDKDKAQYEPYKLDKLIYLIGENYGNPKKSIEFAEDVKRKCVDENG